VGVGVEFGVLGPLHVRIDGNVAQLGGHRQRALLAILALHANEPVSTDRLIDELWGENPPARAVHTVQVFVSRLRAALGPAGSRLVTRSPGYALELDSEEIDTARCERLYDAARSALNIGDAARAHALLTDAQSLWRGPPLADFTYEPFAQATIARLAELRLSCREELIEAQLALGRHAEAVSDLEELVREHPVRERPRGQLMLALYRCGRQAEALEAFHQTRRMLVEELALEPSPALRELEQRILRQDPSLGSPTAPEGERRGPRVTPSGEEATAEPDHPVAVDQPAAAASGSPSLVRKMVTVLAARLELAAPADPEVTRIRISQARDEMERIIRRYGGTVVSKVGGGLTGVFGLPVTREDDALRALRTAEELLARTSELTAAEPWGGMVVRAFIDTGEIVADLSGDLSGPPVDAAIALVHSADESQVLLSDATRRVASGAVSIEPALDGAAWRLLSVIGDAPVRRANQPMVDRHSELATARMAFDRVTRTGKAHLLTILGEAGIGKSRLAQELAEELGSQARVLAGRCLSYGEGIAFWPLREALAQAGGGESREVIRSLLDDADDADVVADIVAAMLGLAPAESVAEQVPWAFRRLMEVLAIERPVILVLEDVHWGEAPLLDLVDYLVDWLNVPALVLCLARPDLLETRPGWGGGHERVSSLLLSRLPSADARLMLDNQLGDRRISEAASAEILETAEGNPLFVEQLLETTMEDPFWDQEPHVPPTIQSLLAARLDRLGPGERAFIERAAVIGREFWPTAVAELLPPQARASAVQHLRALVRRGLIHPDRSTIAGEEQLRFHHILIRDVAYHTTSKSLRAELHERYADWLAQRGEQYDEFIGYHFEQAWHFRREVAGADDLGRELPAKAGEHLAAAGRRAALRGDSHSAVSLLRRAGGMFDAAGDGRPDVLLDLGTALSESGEMNESEQLLNASLRQAEAIGAEAIRARALIELSSLRALVDPRARVEEVQAVVDEAIAVFKRLGDEAGLSRALLEVADIHWTRCCFGEMEQALEQALTHAERAGSRERAQILPRLAQAVVMGPRPVDDAVRRCEEILERLADDVLSCAFTQTMLAVLEAMRGRFDEARTLWRDSQRRLHDVGRSVSASSYTVYAAFIELMSDAPEDLGPELAETCASLQSIGDRSRLSTAAALYARLLYAQGRYDESERYAGISAEAAADDDLVSQVVMRATRGKLLARRGETARAEELVNGAVELAAQTDFLVAQADALRDRSEVLRILGRPRAAARDLERAISLYERKGVGVSAEATRRSHRSLLGDLAAGAQST
jgi:DNA-binding SARP family transcriptional activator/predicted ATPase/class 3 adenylate cyclase